MKEFIEMPFGAKDSELCGWEYTIPEGFVASIENGKIIVKKEESKDEKVRKEIIEYLTFKYEDPNAVRHDYEKWIAWLEKQCEQKSIWSEEDETALCDALWCCKQATSIAKDENDMGNAWYAERWLKSLKERLKGE